MQNVYASQIPQEDEVIPTTTKSEGRVSKNRYSILQEHLRHYEAKNSHNLDSLLPILSASSAELREACEVAMKGVEQWFHDCNGGRWRGFFAQVDKTKNKERQDALIQQLDAVKKALDHFRRVERVKLVEPFERFFDPATGRQLKPEKDAFIARSVLCRNTSCN